MLRPLPAITLTLSLLIGLSAATVAVVTTHRDHEQQQQAQDALLREVGTDLRAASQYVARWERTHPGQ